MRDIFAITQTVAGVELGQRHMTRCWVFDVEDDLDAEMAAFFGGQVVIRAVKL